MCSGSELVTSKWKELKLNSFMFFYTKLFFVVLGVNFNDLSADDGRSGGFGPKCAVSSAC